MSDIDWFTVFIGVVIMGGFMIYVLAPSKTKTTIKYVPSANHLNLAANNSKSNPVKANPAPNAPVKLEPLKKTMEVYSKAEVAKHNKQSDCWIIVDGIVYDVTTYIDEHPGGESIMTNAGGDASEGVHGPQHPPSMWDVIKLYQIGTLAK